jgi:peptidylprolyl isomerase
VANEKRQRQDALRAEKIARELAEQKVAARKKQTRLFATIGGLVAVALVGLLALTALRGGDDTGAGEKISIPDGAPPKKITVTDVKVGSGEVVQKGDTIQVKYTGVAWSTKKQFDSNWDTEGEAGKFTVTNVGTDDAPVIKGWKSLVGAKVGGTRRLVIPPDLAYGKEGQPPSIKSNETLVFDVKILTARRGK